MSRRLVAEEELGLLRERTRKRDPLLLAAGELSGKMVEPSAETDELQQLLRPLRVELSCRERDVLVGGEVRQEVRALEDVGDAAPAQVPARGVVE